MNILYQPEFIRGFGTYKLRAERLMTALEQALNVGYRAIDTAQMYENEQEIGQVLRHHPVARSELCITTKVLPANYSAERFMTSVAQSLAALNVEQVDVLLLHSPPKQDFSATLRLLEQAQRQGLTKYIGLSNFSPQQMVRAREAIAAPLVVNQVEFHPLLDQSNLLQAAVATQIPLSSYCSIARGKCLNTGLFRVWRNIMPARRRKLFCAGFYSRACSQIPCPPIRREWLRTSRSSILRCPISTCSR